MGHMEEHKNVVVIGSGLGGLACAVILAKNGYHVTVLEQAAQIGGCLQCFTRKGVKFETGMHFIGSAAHGQTLDKMMHYLEIDKDVHLSPLDPQGYDVISLGEKIYRIPNGRDAFLHQMTKYFPDQKDNLINYFDLIENIANASSLHSLKKAETDSMINAEYQLRSINDVMDKLFTNSTLANVLVGNLPLYAAEKDKTPFSTHAFIADFYNQSAFRIQGGSDIIAKALMTTINRYGGEVLARKKVTRIICNDTQAVAVEVNGEEQIPCDYVISDAHPIRTLELLDSKLIRPAFRKRICQIPQTVGCFAVYLHFKENTVPYMNYNYYGYQNDTPWDCEKYTEDEWPKGFLYMHFCQQDQQKYATSGVILSYMKMSDVERWKGTPCGKRGIDYERFKEYKVEKLFHALEKQVPGLGKNICHYYTSTPLTYLDYTGTESGSMYGNAKDISLGAACRVPQRTRVPNVYLTGQNINSHGMLGVLVGTIVTCSEFVGAKTIYEQIKGCEESTTI